MTRNIAWILLAIMGAAISTFAADSEVKKTKTIVVEVEEKRFPPRSISAMERRNTLLFEVLGRAGNYSVQFDRALSETWSVGGGIAIQGVANLTYASFPLFANYYFKPENDRFYATAGLTFSTASAVNLSPAVLTTGAGYEFRGEKGFLIRLGPYVNFSSASVSLWFGLGLGYSFDQI